MNLKTSLTTSLLFTNNKQVHKQQKQDFFNIKKYTRRIKNIQKTTTQQQQINKNDKNLNSNQMDYKIFKKLQNLNVKQLHYTLAQTDITEFCLQFKIKQPKKKRISQKINSYNNMLKQSGILQYKNQTICENSEIKLKQSQIRRVSIQKKYQQTQKSLQLIDKHVEIKKCKYDKNINNNLIKQKQQTQLDNSNTKLISKKITSLFSNSTPIYQQRQFCQLTINDFQLLKQIGQGSYSKVHMAIHKRTGFICALKILQKSLMKQLKVQENAIRQIKILSCLSSHPNIITLYGSFSDQKKIYLLMELCTDGDLYHKFKKQRINTGNNKNNFNNNSIINNNNNSLNNNNNQNNNNNININSNRQQNKGIISCIQQCRINILKQVCMAIQQIHYNNIMHRDIKPQNILITFSNNIKLSDFGWSVYNPKQNLRKTLCGTPLYLAPQFITNSQYTQSIDIWSLGIMTYQMFTNEFPFQIKSINDLVKIVQEDIDFQKIKCKEVKDFCKKILVRDYRKRPDIEELSEHQIFNIPINHI